MNQNLLDKLRAEVKTNPAAESVFHVLATRNRSRSSLTLGALNQRMKAEGFKHDREDYRKIIAWMAKLGFGQVMLNKRGRPAGLKDISVNLVALGKLACGTQEEAKAQKPLHYETEKTLGISIRPVGSLDLLINGKPAVIQFTQGLTAEELSSLVHKLQASA